MSIQDLYNTTYTVQQRTDTADDTGAMVETFGTASGERRGRLGSSGQGKIKTPARFIDRHTNTLICDPDSNINETCRIVCGGNNFRVLLKVDAAGHGHHDTCLLERTFEGNQ